MVARLGNVLYWLGCLVAVPFVLWAGGNAAVLAGAFGGSTMPGENAWHIAVSLGAAIGAWLTGRALRYILAGT